MLKKIPLHFKILKNPLMRLSRLHHIIYGKQITIYGIVKRK